MNTVKPAQLALAMHLNIAPDDRSIESRGQQHDIYTFVVNGTMYFVGLKDYEMNSDITIEAGGFVWTVLENNPSQPYVRFTDTFVRKHLDRICVAKHTVLAINQTHHRALLRDAAGQLSVWAYRVDIPEVISTYRYSGNANLPLSTMKSLFPDVMFDDSGLTANDKRLTERV